MRLTATGADPASAIGAALTGLLAAATLDTIDPRSVETATTALPLRAEASDLAELFAKLASSLRDVVDQGTDDVLAVRVDGVRRIDEGLRGWGYALAAQRPGASAPISVSDIVASEESDGVTIQATLRRADD